MCVRTKCQTSEVADQRGILIGFRAPAALAKLIDQSAGRELLTNGEWCRRAIDLLGHGANP